MAKTILKDFPSGPLDRYRKKASFDWKEMKILLEGEDIILYISEVTNILKKYPIFQSVKSDATLKQIKYQSAMRSLTFKKLMIADWPDLNTRQHMALWHLLFC